MCFESLLCVCLAFVSLFPHSCVSPSPGAIQSFAGFADYFTAMAQEGWFPLLCVGLRPQWEDHHLQDLQDSYGQEWVSSACHLLAASSYPVPGTFVGIVQCRVSGNTSPPCGCCGEETFPHCPLDRGGPLAALTGPLYLRLSGSFVIPPVKSLAQSSRVWHLFH